MKFTLNIVALPLLSLLLATMALAAPTRGDETIRDASPISGPISERAAAPAAMVEKRFRFTRDSVEELEQAVKDARLRLQIHEALCKDNGIQEACDEAAQDAITVAEISGGFTY